MSVVIIIGGGPVRNAVTHLENVSVGFSKSQRDAAEARLAAIAAELEGYANNPNTL